MIATLGEFLRTGRLGGLTFGASRAEVCRLLGPPQDVSVQRRPLIWKYGALEASFTDGRLVLLSLLFHDARERIPGRLGLIGWIPTRTTTLRQLEGQLVREGIAFQMTHAWEDWIILRTGAGIGLHFDRDGTRTSLHSIQGIATESVSPDDIPSP